ncbi:HlyD family secretion protein [Rugamonas brunnea]|nr:HlyD family efflux transporter periplasmic adaptor subunit [Rugamonas brunnea]
MTTQAPAVPNQAVGAQAAAQPAATAPAARRKAMLVALAAALGVAAVGYGAYWYSSARFQISTDDAYVAGNVIQLTPQVAGTVVAIHADDTNFVQAGTVLAQLDPTDAKLALEKAKTQLAQTVRQTEALFLNQSAQSAAVALREAELRRARADLAQRSVLKGSGAVSEEEIRHAEDGARTAAAALEASRQQYAASRALAGAGAVREHPAVAQAVAALQEAQLTLDRTAIIAPQSGYVARRSVQIGQRVAVGAPLLAVVPLDQLWVDANFKESQLRHMRIGQPVTLTADLFGHNVVYHGRVAGLGAGTGSAFSLLPAQNATGNWIKVVQRLPVRVALEPSEVAAHPLRVGLSMVAEVDVSQQSGAQLAGAISGAPVAQTSVYQAQAGARAGVADIANQIVRANLLR